MKLNIHKFLFLTSLILFNIGLVCSKALISIGSVGIILSTLIHLFAEKRFKSIEWKEIMGYCLLLAMPFISGLWSANTGDWIDGFLNKIMLPALAASILYAIKLENKEYLYMSLFQAFMVLIGSLYSVSAYLYMDMDINKSYLTAKTLPVLLNNDHLHFSQYVVITLVLLFGNRDLYKEHLSKTANWLLVACAFWLMLYLHILGAKTGLIFLYLSIILIVFSNDLIRKPFYYKLAVIPVSAILILLAYNCIPSFYNRFHYTQYDFNQYIHGKFINGLTDGARVLSWKAGAEIASQNPLMGIGFGDMNDTFMQWHAMNSTQLEKYNWLQPSNEWLMYFCGAGILGLASLTIGLYLIYHYSRLKYSVPFFILFIIQILMMWYEVNLNNQIGISLFAFSLSWYSIRPNSMAAV